MLRKDYDAETLLKKFVRNGTLVHLQEYFIQSTNGFGALVKIANGEEINGKHPTIREQIEAMKIMLDKSLPDLQATHVDHNYRVESKPENINIEEIKAEFALLEEEVGQVGS
jgi:hypothetical protein